MAKTVLAIAVALTLLWGGTASAGVSPEHKCQAGKNKAAGKYAACLQNAEAKFVTSGDALKHGDAIAKCATKLDDKWKKLEAAAAKKNVSCPDAPLIQANFKTVLDEHSDNITSGLGGGGLVWCGNGVKDGSESCDGSDLGGKSCTSFGFASGTLVCTASCGFNTTGCNPIVCGNGTIDPGEQCDQNNLNGKTCADEGFGGGTLACGPGCLFDTGRCFNAPRFADNGDGTVTDQQTGLMWEKKGHLDGVANGSDPHDADNTYTLAADNPSGPPGTAFTVFLVQVNGGGGLAGHTDWRLPTREELESIVDYADALSPVVDAAFDTGCIPSCAGITCSCTASSRHWSSSTLPSDAGQAWFFSFSDGSMDPDKKDTVYSARAVRP